jgi:hypothetical protein
MISFIHSQTADCSTARPVTESDLCSHFCKKTDYSQAIEILSNTVFPDIDFPGDFWVSLAPRHPLKCHLRGRKWGAAPLPQILTAGLVICAGVALAAVIVRCARGWGEGDAAFLVQEMVRRSRAGATEFDPDGMRADFGKKWSERKWRSVKAAVEGNPLICVLRGQRGGHWRVMWAGERSKGAKRAFDADGRETKVGMA